MKMSIPEFEKKRLLLQKDLDAKKDINERKLLGQFATPTRLADDILSYAKAHFNQGEKVQFIDPAIGTGAFCSALLNNFPKSSIGKMLGFEIDPYYGVPAMNLWGGQGLEVYIKDFTKAEAPECPEEKFNLLICNPPYVRHHYIQNQEKQRLKQQVFNNCGVEINGMAGLYCYYLGISHAWMKCGGVAGWLIPSEFMDVNYGASVKQYLINNVTLLHVHRFDSNDVQFDDALVSSAVVWFRKLPPPVGHKVKFTYGGSLHQPQLERFVPLHVLGNDPKWTRYPMEEDFEIYNEPVLRDFFIIKRGLVTGNNSFFILSLKEIEQRELPIEAFKPILPSPRYLMKDEVESDIRGNPILERKLFLLDPPWVEEEIKKKYPRLWAYLEEGKKQGIADGYLCQRRNPWYLQESRTPAPFVCTYLGRSSKKNAKPFRFILNNSKAIAANVYLMLYPRITLKQKMQDNDDLKRQIWLLLKEICTKTITAEGRVYGGGLHKLEPRELGNVPARFLQEFLSESNFVRKNAQLAFFD
ncbi:MAG: class I SAM-dependent methyltransferase [Bacilli bacterium]|nr:class I SAM-dependent methyltransferase [Bacilli bacterium]